MILDPNATNELARGGAIPRRHIEDQGANVADEFAAHVFEIVGAAVELISVGYDHLREPGRVEDRRVALAKPGAGEEVLVLNVPADDELPDHVVVSHEGFA